MDTSDIWRTRQTYFQVSNAIHHHGHYQQGEAHFYKLQVIYRTKQKMAADLLSEDVKDVYFSVLKKTKIRNKTIN